MENKQEKKLHLKGVRKEFLVMATTACVQYGSYAAVMNLQTSINIKDGVGILYGTLIPFCCMLSCLFLTPFYIRRFGAKNAFVVSGLGYIVFILSSMFPDVQSEWYMIVPVVLCCGFAAATMWPCTSMYNVHYGGAHSSVGSKSTTEYVQRYTARFFGVLQFNQIFGNFISWITLQLSPQNDANFTNISGLNLSNLDESAINITEVDYSMCGSADCQNPNITSSNMDRYVPSQTSILILTSVLLVSSLLATLAQVLVLPDIKRHDELSHNRNDSSKGFSNPSFVADALDIKASPPPYSVSHTLKNSTNHSSKDVPEKMGMLKFMLKTLKATGKHMVCPLHLLVVPLTIYDGMIISFAMSELTRAYASCVMGVTKVGLCMMAYGAGDIIFSFLTEAFPNSKPLTRNLPIVISAIIDIVNFSLCLTWTPSLNTSYIIFVFFFGVGCSDGFWQTTLNLRYAEYFSDRQDIAFNTWGMWLAVGGMIQYGWSSYVCVHSKIYVMFALLFVSFGLYAIAEWKFYKDRKNIDNNIEAQQENKEHIEISQIIKEIPVFNTTDRL